MYLAQDNFLRKITLFISFFSFLFLWDIGFNYLLQLRFLILLYFFYLIIYNFNEFKNIFPHIILIFFVLLSHQFVNIYYESTNSNFIIINQLNKFIINKWPNEIQHIYFLASKYTLNHFLAIIGITIVYTVIKLNKIELKKYFYLFIITFVIFIFFTDILMNFNKIEYTNEWSMNSLCNFYLSINKKTFKIFLENSHFGMVAPSIFIFLCYKLSKKINLLNIFLILLFTFTIFFNFSATLLAGILLSIIFINFILIKKTNSLFKVFSIFIFIVIVLIHSYKDACSFRTLEVIKLLNYNSYIEKPTNKIDIEKLNNIDIEKSKINDDIRNKVYNDIKVFNDLDDSIKEELADISTLNKIIKYKSNNLTVEVLFNHINLAFNSLKDRPFGWGLNRYGNAFSYYQPRMPMKFGELRSLNYNDGASNFSKLIVEFGIFSILLFFLLLYFSFSKKFSIEDKIFLLPFLITQMGRGAGYFNGGYILVVMIILFIIYNSRKK